MQHLLGHGGGGVTNPPLQFSRVTEWTSSRLNPFQTSLHLDSRPVIGFRVQEGLDADWRIFRDNIVSPLDALRAGCSGRSNRKNLSPSVRCSLSQDLNARRAVANECSYISGSLQTGCDSSGCSKVAQLACSFSGYQSEPRKRHPPFKVLSSATRSSGHNLSEHFEQARTPVEEPISSKPPRLQKIFSRLKRILSFADLSALLLRACAPALLAVFFFLAAQGSSRLFSAKTLNHAWKLRNAGLHATASTSLEWTQDSKVLPGENNKFESLSVWSKLLLQRRPSREQTDGSLSVQKRNTYASVYSNKADSCTPEAQCGAATCQPPVLPNTSTADFTKSSRGDFPHFLFARLVDSNQREEFCRASVRSGNVKFVSSEKSNTPSLQSHGSTPSLYGSSSWEPDAMWQRAVGQEDRFHHTELASETVQAWGGVGASGQADSSWQPALDIAVVANDVDVEGTDKAVPLDVSASQMPGASNNTATSSHQCSSSPLPTPGMPAGTPLSNPKVPAGTPSPDSGMPAGTLLSNPRMPAGIPARPLHLALERSPGEQGLAEEGPRTMDVDLGSPTLAPGHACNERLARHMSLETVDAPSVTQTYFPPSDRSCPSLTQNGENSSPRDLPFPFRVTDPVRRTPYGGEDGLWSNFPFPDRFELDVGEGDRGPGGMNGQPPCDTWQSRSSTTHLESIFPWNRPSIPPSAETSVPRKRPFFPLFVETPIPRNRSPTPPSAETPVPSEDPYLPSSQNGHSLSDSCALALNPSITQSLEPSPSPTPFLNPSETPSPVSSRYSSPTPSPTNQTRSDGQVEEPPFLPASEKSSVNTCSVRLGSHQKTFTEPFAQRKSLESSLSSVLESSRHRKEGHTSEARKPLDLEKEPFGSHGCLARSSQALNLANVLLRQQTWFPRISGFCGTGESGFGRSVDLIGQLSRMRRKKGNAFVKAAAERAGPAVVRLDTERAVPQNGMDGFFGQLFGEHDLTSPKTAKREWGQGSGFVVDGRKGIIITNAHVVKGAEKLKVSFPNGRVVEGTLIGIDDVTELAVLKVAMVDSQPLPQVVLGDSRKVDVGDWVIAVGNPFGLDNSVSLGIISNLHRTAAEVGIPNKRMDFLQTDCAINPGNSGGPLLNEFGEVIGITTAIQADAEGIAFAIPMNSAWNVARALLEGRSVNHPFLGFQMAKWTPYAAQDHSRLPHGSAPLPGVEGVLVVQVVPSSPASTAGIRHGDVIRAVDGRAIASPAEVTRLVQASSVGQAFKLRIARSMDGNVRELEVSVLSADMSPFSSADLSNSKLHPKNGMTNPKSNGALHVSADSQTNQVPGRLQDQTRAVKGQSNRSGNGNNDKNDLGNMERNFWTPKAQDFT